MCTHGPKGNPLLTSTLTFEHSQVRATKQIIISAEISSGSNWVPPSGVRLCSWPLDQVVYITVAPRQCVHFTTGVGGGPALTEWRLWMRPLPGMSISAPTRWCTRFTKTGREQCPGVAACTCAVPAGLWARSPATCQLEIVPIATRRNEAANDQGWGGGEDPEGLHGGRGRSGRDGRDEVCTGIRAGRAVCCLRGFASWSRGMRRKRANAVCSSRT